MVQPTLFLPSMHSSIAEDIQAYRTSKDTLPRFYAGDALEVLRLMPSESVDCCMTSPPYWGHREYESAGIGLEADVADYVLNLMQILLEVKRVLKPSGSLWLNLGDTYLDKNLMGMPWRVAFALMNEGFLLRNSVIWHKLKGAPDNAKDKLRNVHENLFHFVTSKTYFYDVDQIRNKPRASTVSNGKVVSATGVSGVRYKRQLELSTALSNLEKQQAIMALEATLKDVEAGKISDFRMVIRGQQRTTHSDQARVSGRAKELLQKGFYFLKYHPNGAKPSDVWEILPEDTQKRESHFAPFPEDLCRIPILATCPTDGLVLDPFCGTGTTMQVALQTGRKSIGIDISKTYLNHAKKRCGLHE
jgi:site-specific DNA-methyltransferase (adenine-specific)